jgi:hypothetical protein
LTVPGVALGIAVRVLKSLAPCTFAFVVAVAFTVRSDPFEEPAHKAPGFAEGVLTMIATLGANLMNVRSKFTIALKSVFADRLYPSGFRDG